MDKFKIANGKEIKEVNLKDPHLASFLGAFVSEGNLSEKGASLKISNKNLDFLEYTLDSIKAILGNHAATTKAPTREHRDGDEGFHKYFSVCVAKILMNGYGIRPGKKVLNNEGLPPLIIDAIFIFPQNTWVKPWLVNYLQMRYSGDGHIRNNESFRAEKIVRDRSIVLTKNNRLKIESFLEKDVSKNYREGKKVKEYPKNLISALKRRARISENYPLELLQVQFALKKVFGIKARLECSGICSIYRDKRRDILLVTAHYKLVISRREDTEKFYHEINFAPFDAENRLKLKRMLSTYCR